MSAVAIPFPDEEPDMPDAPEPALDPAGDPAPVGGVPAQGVDHGPHRARPFRTIGLRDLRKLPKPGWVVDGLIPDDSITLIYGPANQGKSLLIWSWLLCIATGKPFFGRKVTAGHIAYVCGEGLRGLAPRIDAWLLQWPEEERAELEALIDERVHVVPEPFSLIDSQAAERWIETCREYNVVAAAIDTYSRMMTGADENSAESVSRAVDTCERARAATGASVVLAHHANADGSRERGSTLVRGAAGSASSVTQSPDGLITLSNNKMKEAGLFPDQYFELVPYGDSVTVRQTTGIAAPAGAGQPRQSGGQVRRKDQHPAAQYSNPFGDFR